jgi:hypothetical protein
LKFNFDFNFFSFSADEPAKELTWIESTALYLVAGVGSAIAVLLVIVIIVVCCKTDNICVCCILRKPPVLVPQGVSA